MEWIGVPQFFLRIWQLGLRRVNRLHAIPKRRDVRVSVSRIFWKLFKHSPAQQFRQVALLDGGLHRRLTVESLVAGVQNSFADFVLLRRFRCQQRHHHARPLRCFDCLSEPLEKILQSLVPERAAVLAHTRRIRGCRVMRPHQEFIHQDQRALAAPFNLAQDL